MPPSVVVRNVATLAPLIDTLTTLGPRLAAVPQDADRLRARVPCRVLGERLFKDVIIRERKRADRFGTPFAVLLVDRGDPSSRGCHWAPVLRALSAVKRDVDVFGWLERGTVLGLLLPEARPLGALAVVERVRREIAARLGDKALEALSLRIYAHGDDSQGAGVVLPPADLLVEAFLKEQSRPWHDTAKRCLDVAASLILLVLFSPVALAISVAIRLTSPGPVLFRQVRIGRRGEPFTMLKFRTMHVNGDDKVHRDYVTWFIRSSAGQPRTGREVFKLTNDPRVTQVGRILRKTSLDELPQFWNVLRGEMSLVGPRPPLPFEVEQYQPWHRRRVLEAKPGVTGPWQVHGRSRTTFDEMVRIDLHYARTHSLWTDIKILAATPRAMLTGKGAC